MAFGLLGDMFNNSCKWEALLDILYRAETGPGRWPRLRTCNESFYVKSLMTDPFCRGEASMTLRVCCGGIATKIALKAVCLELLAFTLDR